MKHDSISYGRVIIKLLNFIIPIINSVLVGPRRFIISVILFLFFIFISLMDNGYLQEVFIKSVNVCYNDLMRFIKIMIFFGGPFRDAEHKLIYL